MPDKIECWGKLKSDKESIVDLFDKRRADKITELKGCPENYWELDKQFESIFPGMHINYFLDQLAMMGIFSFDIVKFDDWYKKYFGNYEEKGISLKDAIKENQGPKVVKLLEQLIK